VPNLVDDKPATTAGATPAQIVEALKTVAGNPPKVRASFAKGRCVTGRYIPAPRAGEVTASPSFTEPGPIVGRFSVGGGNPAAPDTNGLVLRGFSVRLTGGGQRTDLLTENAPVHFARTLDQMLAFLQARFPGPDGKPDPLKVKAFSDANPETLNQAKFVAARPLPGSFAGVTFWGVHAFPVTNAEGVERFIKFQLVPSCGEINLTEADAAQKGPNFLVEDLAGRIEEGGVRYDVLAILDRPGDLNDDVTARWADEDERERILLGVIEITGFADDAECDATIFDPFALADGVGHPVDELFAARRPAYLLSLAKRR
jgi:catalase